MWHGCAIVIIDNIDIFVSSCFQDGQFAQMGQQQQQQGRRDWGKFLAITYAAMLIPCTMVAYSYLVDMQDHHRHLKYGIIDKLHRDLDEIKEHLKARESINSLNRAKEIKDGKDPSDTKHWSRCMPVCFVNLFH